jgi:murein DD-endopeptidase MepM/ murein hydrolase activator NlpD
MTSGFGPRNPPKPGASSFHAGVDYGYPTGTPLMAPGNGIVVKSSGIDGDHGGNRVTTRFKDANGDIVDVTYMHMSTTPPKAGTVVNTGDIIGKVGNTGLGTGAHLHLETRKNGTLVDPRSVFNG